MFELKISWKYLIPKRRALSTSLISLLSVFVISLVVWLVLVFLSVTGGIENNWLHKLTSLNAPIRITPTNEYYSSYYYRIDQISSASGFTQKSIGEKALSTSTDPYQPEIDLEIPRLWPSKLLYDDGAEVDLVRDLYSVLDGVKSDINGFAYHDYELSGALMKLNLLRPDDPNIKGLDSVSSSISQMSYLLSYANNNPNLPSILVPPSIEDLNHLLQTANLRKDRYLQHLSIKRVKSCDRTLSPLALLDTKYRYKAYLSKHDIIVPINTQKKISGKQGELVYENKWKFIADNSSLAFQRIVLDTPVTMEVFSYDESQINVGYDLQGQLHNKAFVWPSVELLQAKAITEFEKPPEFSPPWAYTVKESGKTHVPDLRGASGVLIPKSYKRNGARLGDSGSLSFHAPSAGSIQEHSLPIHVAGFYDPGMIPIGNKCLLVPSHITQTLNGLTQIYSPDGTPTNGVFIWHNDIGSSYEVKKQIENRIKLAGLDRFWKVETFHNFEFSKDLMQQFQSDRMILSLIAGIILIVACSNIISMLVLLVNDKKKEIATLQAMGASSKSIAAIFGICGATIGVLSSGLGVVAAIFTLRNLDGLVSFLSKIQGHAAFNAAFFGDKLPNELSLQALSFVVIITPVISIIAGLVPAIKAARLKASTVLRSE